VYFFGANGLFQPAALLAAIKYFTKLKDERLLIDFTKHRREFEEFLVQHRHYINQLAKSKGSRTRPVDSLVALYELVLQDVKNGRNHSEIVETLRSDERLKDLEDLRDEQRPRKKFSKDTRSAVYLKSAVESPIRCAVCGARMRSQAISSDHIKRVEDGGMGNAENLQFTHFFCNSGYKESLHSRQSSKVIAEEEAQG
jgi:hypothetical protein